MDQNEYLKRFRLAILWDEFKRREVPQVDVEEIALNEWWQLYRKLSEKDRQSVWQRILANANVINYCIRSAFDDGVLTTSNIDNLAIYTWSLSLKLERIRNPDIRDYYGHLIYVAEQLIAAVSNEKSPLSDEEIRERQLQRRKVALREFDKRNSGK